MMVMKKRLFAFCMAVSLPVAGRGATPPFADEPERWSYSIDLGAGFIQDTQVTPPDPNYPDLGVGFDPGARLDAGIAYALRPWLQIGVASGYSWNGVRSLLGFTPDSGGFSQIPIMAEATVRGRFGDHLEGFIGAGAGGIYSRLDLLGPPNDGWLKAKGSSFVGAAEVFAGLTCNLGRRTHLGLAYRYFWSEDLEWDVTFWDPFVDTVRIGVHTGNLHNHAVVVFFRAGF